MNGLVKLSPDKLWKLAVIQMLSSINKEMAERKSREPISKERIYK